MLWPRLPPLPRLLPHRPLPRLPSRRWASWSTPSLPGASSDITISSALSQLVEFHDAKEAQVEAAKLDVSSYGVQLTDKGVLEVVDLELASQPAATALVVGGVPLSVRSDDFRRLVDTQEGGEITHALPLRTQAQTRTHTWVLAFSNPLHAATYKASLTWHNENLDINAPRPASQAIWPSKNLRVPAPMGYLDPATRKDIWRGVNRYTLSTLAQRSLNVRVVLPPQFAGEIAGLVGQWEEWNVHAAEEGEDMTRCYAVRVSWEDDVVKMALSTLRNLVAAFGDALVEGPLAIEDLGGDWEEDGDGDQHCHAWILRFKSEDDAMRFWMRWHRVLVEDPRRKEKVSVVVDTLS